MVSPCASSAYPVTANRTTAVRSKLPLARQASAEESTPAAETTQPVEKAEVVPPSPNDRSQPAPELPHYPKPLGLWLAQPTKPKTFAAGTGGLYGELEPV